MYKNINISQIETAAEKIVIDNDRMLFMPYFIRVEEYCRDNNIIIGGKRSAQILSDETYDRNSFFMDLYCENTYQLAKNLADILINVKSDLPARTISLQTNIKHREFTLSIYARILFKIYAIDIYRGVKLADIMSVEHMGIFSKTSIKCFAPILQLIDIYRTLYSPSKNSEWDDTLRYEKVLYNIGIIHRDITGASNDNNILSLSDTISSSDTLLSNDTYTHIDNLIIGAGVPIDANNYLEAVRDQIIIGDYALMMLGYIKTKSRLQVICNVSVEELRIRVEKIAPKNKYSIIVIKYALNLPNDFQLTKHIIYMVTGKHQIPIMDVFNASTFEMIPYTMKAAHDKHQYMIAAPIVILRFLLIDIWTLMIIARLDKHQARLSVNSRMKELESHIAIIHSDVINAQSHMIDYKYGGIYIDESVVKKKIVESLGKKIPIYYPAINSAHIHNDLKLNIGQPNIITGGDLNILDMFEQEGPTNTDAPMLYTHDIIRSSRPINLQLDIQSKIQIASRITGSSLLSGATSGNIFNITSSNISNNMSNITSNDILSAIASFAQHTKSNLWGISKSASFEKKNSQFLPYLRNNIDTVVDIGCGSGLEIAAVKHKYHVKTAICVDIADYRKDKRTKFVKLVPGQIIAINDSVADIVMMFHCIHHMIDDLDARIADIARICKQDALIFIKDHNITNDIEASNVDFEHWVYLAAELRDEPEFAKMPMSDYLIKIANDFPHLMPLKYYSADNMIKQFASYFDVIWRGNSYGNTYSYSAVLRKKI